MTILLVDAGAFFVRRIAAAVLKDMRGEYSGELLIEHILQSAINLVINHDASYALFAFDHETAYLGNNSIPVQYSPKLSSMPDYLTELLPSLRQELHKAGLATLDIPGREADAAIAIAAKNLSGVPAPIHIICNDLKILQLLKPGIQVFEHFTQRERSRRRVHHELGIYPEQIADYLALVGTRGGLSGVPGIGPIRAADLLTNYGSLEQVLSAAEQHLLPLPVNSSLLRERDILPYLKDSFLYQGGVSLGLNLRDLNIYNNMHLLSNPAA